MTETAGGAGMETTMDVNEEAKAIEAGWHPEYLPTIRLEVDEDGVEHAPSCESVALTVALRDACIASGRGYFDGERTVGQLHMRVKRTR